MTRIERLDAEILKARERIAEQQARIRTLEGQKTDEENNQIVQMVRKQRIPIAELERYLKRIDSNLKNPTKTPPVTAAVIKKESEENPDEKN